MTALTTPPFDLSEGQRRKRHAQTVLESQRQLYVLRGRRALLNALLKNESATIDSVRRCVEIPPGFDPRLFGAVPGPLAEAGIIEMAGFRRTRRIKAHARIVLAWRLLDRAKALEWLAQHPERDGAVASGAADVAACVARLTAHPDRPDPVEDDGAGQSDLNLFE